MTGFKISKTESKFNKPNNSSQLKTLQRISESSKENSNQFVKQCCDELRMMVTQKNRRNWHQDHIKGMMELISEHEKSANLIEFESKLKRIATDSSANKARTTLQSVYQSLIENKLDPNEAIKRAKNTIKQNEYKNALRSIYAQELLDNFSTYKQKIFSIEKEFSKNKSNVIK